MKRIAFTTSLALGLVLAAGTASAQDDGSETMFYDFNDMLIDGELLQPEGMFATERGRARFDSLLSLRRSFMEEIEDAAHEDALR